MKVFALVGMTVLLALAPAMYLAWQARDVPHLGSFHDDAIYLESARGLARGEGYRLGTLPGKPAQTKYPPLYPAWLLIAWWGDAAVDTAASRALWLTWAWLPVLVAGVYRLSRQAGWGQRWALALAAGIALQPDVQLAATRLMSDLPFAALAMWALVLAPGKGSVVCAVMGFGVRTAALPLFAGLCAAELWARRWRSAAWQVLGMLLAVGAWMLWSGSVRTAARTIEDKYYTDYFAYQLAMVPLAELPAHAWNQVDALLRALCRMALLDLGDGLLAAGLRFLVAAAIVSGLWRLLRAGRMVAGVVYVLLGLGMSLCWYFPPDSRTLLPLLPVLMMALGEEAKNFRTLLHKAWEKGGGDRVAAVVLGLLVALLPAIMLPRGMERWRKEGLEVFALERGFQPGKRAAYQWIRENLDERKLFFAVDDPVLSLHTGRLAMRYPQLNQVYLGDASSGYRLAPQAQRTMREHGLDCVFVSRQHFDPDPRDPYRELRFDLNGTGLTERYRSRLELVACRD